MGLLISFVNTAFQVYTYILLARIILSWVPHDPFKQPIVRWIYQLTEPILAPARRIIPPIGMVDISPIAVFMILELIRRFVLTALMRIYF